MAASKLELGLDLCCPVRTQIDGFWKSLEVQQNCTISCSFLVHSSSSVRMHRIHLGQTHASGQKAEVTVPLYGKRQRAMQLVASGTDVSPQSFTANGRKSLKK